MNQKLLYSNKLSTYLLKKYFNIKFYFQKKQNKNDEMSKLLEDKDNKKKTNFKNFNHTNSITHKQLKNNLSLSESF